MFYEIFKCKRKYKTSLKISAKNEGIISSHAFLMLKGVQNMNKFLEVCNVSGQLSQSTSYRYDCFSLGE